MAATFTNLLYHIIFSTKQRAPLITAELRTDLYPYIGGIVRAQHSILLEIGGMPDHVHLVLKLIADVSVAEIVRLVKANSSKWINDNDTIRSFAWQTGYAAFTVSESQLPKLRTYVTHQEAHHRQRTFQEEVLQLLQRHNIEYDERYVWD